MKIVLENLTTDRVNQLDYDANNRIQIRGYHPRYDIPADFKDSELFLPFNEIPIKYCPTDRYSYLHKYESSALRNPTWESFTGKILDETYDKFITKLLAYLRESKLSSVNVLKYFESINETFLEKQRQLIESKKDTLQTPPKAIDIEKFDKLLISVLRYETQLASSLIDYKISMHQDLELASTVMLLMPILVKPTYTVTMFGITNKAQPDFMFSNKIMIDVKSPPWSDQFYNTLAGYALAYEKAENKPMNLGVVLTPDLSDKRNVPFYFKSEIIPIEDMYRRAFLLRRENLLTLMKSKKDPGIPDDDTNCKTCTYYKHCFPET